ncbi:MAG: DMT family transporter [Cellulophaga sp.]
MQLKKTYTVGVILAIFGVVLFSSKAILVKLAYEYNIDSVTLLLLRMGFALPFYAVIAIWKKPKSPKEIKKKDYLGLFLFGFLGYYLASYFDFVGLQYIKAGLERIILFIYPTFVIILSFVFFKKKITKAQFMAILITYIGVLITFWNEIGVGGESVYLGGGFILLSALTYAGYLVGSGWLIPKFGAVVFTAYAMLIATFCILVHYSFVGDFQIFNYETEVYFLGLAMAILATVIPSFLVSAAIERLGASTFSIFGSLGPIATIIMAYFFLEEQVSLIQILGMFVVIGGISFVTKRKSRV